MDEWENEGGSVDHREHVGEGNYCIDCDVEVVAEARATRSPDALTVEQVIAERDALAEDGYACWVELNEHLESCAASPSVALDVERLAEAINRAHLSVGTRNFQNPWSKVDAMRLAAEYARLSEGTDR